MNAKTWLRWCFSFSIFLFLSFYLFIIYAEAHYPLRITDSISFDEKLRFLKNSNRLSTSNTVIVGSSLAMINVHGETLENESESIKVLSNLSSWGIQTVQLEQLLQLIANKNKVEYVIFPTQMLDYAFDKKIQLDFTQINKYINNQFTLYLYNRVFLNAFNFLKALYNFNSYHQVDNTYPSLLFDQTGGITYAIYGDDIDPERWDDTRVFGLNMINFITLNKIAELLKEEEIKFFVFTTPMRQQVLDASPELNAQYKKFTRIMNKAAEGNTFHYLNLHEELSLNDDFFADSAHLNDKGSILIAKRIASYIDAFE